MVTFFLRKPEYPGHWTIWGVDFDQPQACKQEQNRYTLTWLVDKVFEFFRDTFGAEPGDSLEGKYRNNTMINSAKVTSQFACIWMSRCSVWFWLINKLRINPPEVFYVLCLSRTEITVHDKSPWFSYEMIAMFFRNSSGAEQDICVYVCGHLTQVNLVYWVGGYIMTPWFHCRQWIESSTLHRCYHVVLWTLYAELNYFTVFGRMSNLVCSTLVCSHTYSVNVIS